MREDADDADDANYARRLVAQRIPELSEDRIAAAFAPGMNAELGELVPAVLDAVAERLDHIEETLPVSAATTEIEAPRPRRVAA